MHNPAMRSLDPTYPDLPPPSFDESFYDFAPESTPSQPKHVVDESKAVRIPIRIARALVGDTEIRLLKETHPAQAGKGSTIFILEHAVISPYTTNRSALTRTRKGVEVPLKEPEALAKFEAAVAEKYPAEKLGNGRTIAIHLKLL